MPSKPTILRCVKIAVSVALLAYLLYSLDIAEALTNLRGANVVPLCAAFLLLFVQVLVSAWKWRIALAIHSLSWPVARLFRILLIAFFFNNFLPTAVGGDVYRVYRTLPAEGMRSTALSALLLDRVVGLLSLLVIGLIGSAVVYAESGDPRAGVLGLLLAGPVAAAAVLPLLLSSNAFAALRPWLARIPKVEHLIHNARLIGAEKNRLLPLFGVSMLFQVLAVSAIVMLFAGMGVYGVVEESAVVSAMYSLAALLPISINGLGLMEGSFAMTASTFGIDFDKAVVVAFALRVFTVPVSFVGGIAYLMDKGREEDFDAVSEVTRLAADQAQLPSSTRS